MNDTLVWAAIAVGLVAGELFPRRAEAGSPYRRWLVNLGLFVLCIACVALVHRLWAEADMARLATVQPFATLLALHDALPRLPTLPWVPGIAAMAVLIDLWKYWEHRAFHVFAPLWRLHLVHHTDPSFDVSTDLRHHPFEMLASHLIALAVFPLLGASVQALAGAMLVHRLASTFNHTNIALPAWLDAALRRVFVTPDFHRIHHSARQAETDSNYGNLLTVWDRLFGTHTREPSAPHATMTLGLEAFADARDQQLLATLGAPFARRIR